jgi:mono/diheme cytochrome c family protein
MPAFSPRRLVIASFAFAAIAAASLAFVSCGGSAEGQNSAAMTPEQKIERGRYLVNIAGCNDCHTNGFMQEGAAIPEDKRLTGMPVGWKGPWGTTYAANLRKTAALFDEAAFIKTMKSAKGNTGRPPMPWPSLAAMSDTDLAAVHAYLKSLGDSGVMMPLALPPGKEPDTPYFDFTPKNLPNP